MNITLLGNGFDLFYKLPTKYSNFLNTVRYLSTTTLSGEQTLGSILGAKTLQVTDPWLAESYQTYSKYYDGIPVSYKEIDTLVRLSQNLWYRFLSKSLDSDTGWIDVEKEIALVIRCFQERFDIKVTDRVLYRDCLSNEAEYIIKAFDYFIDTTPHGSSDLERIKKEYLLEYPRGSGNQVLYEEKIVQSLLDSLKEFTDTLKFYLEIFVEKLLCELAKEKQLTAFKAIRYSDYIVTFNYTSTYEKLNQPSSHVFHVHGSIGDEIVLGVNPDSKDNIETANTTFIQFKKNYQRTMSETDKSYIKWVTDIRGDRDGVADNNLVVFGHSLDISDKDIISELFNVADEIIILYHEPKVITNYISNLVRIFGSDGFSALRYDKKLQFVDLTSDLEWLVEKRKANKPYAAFMTQYMDGETITIV